MGRALLILLIGFFLLFFACKVEPVVIKSPQEIATTWAEMTCHLLKNTPGNSPTFASRTLGYIGLTMYESIVNGFYDHESMAGQVNGLDFLPTPMASQEYDWPTCLNAGQAEILRLIYIQTADTNKIKIDSLENEINKGRATKVKKEVLERSLKYGKSVAQAIFKWSETDGGHRGYLKNFDKTLVFPEFPGSWKPPLYGQSTSRFPLHPHWGDNRTFVKANRDMALPKIIPFDRSKSSPYYKQMEAVYEREKTLTLDEKRAAVWWGDDPDETYTPPGHSYFLATVVMKEKQPELIIIAETYAKLGMSLADAFINCWKWKYHFFTERPNTFINQYIDQQWESFWPDPPFPAFPSGHAIQAAATATVMSSMYGDSVYIQDNTHVGRKPDKLRKMQFVKRTYHSFWAVAEETANSRFYGGIHTNQDNNVGLEKGKLIAENVNQLKWRK